MSPVIRIDDEVWAWLQGQAVPLVDTPNAVLRRVAGLDPTLANRTTPTAKPIRTSFVAAAEPRENEADYRVSKRSDEYGYWWFQIYEKKLDRCIRNGGKHLLVVCDVGTPTEKTFAVPFAYLTESVLPTARMEKDGRYLFRVLKKTSEFVFSGGIRFDGSEFLSS